VGGQRHDVAALSTGMTQYPLYRRLRGLQRLWTGAENLAHPPAFDSRIVQPVASRYADYAIPTRKEETVCVQTIPGAYLSYTMGTVSPPPGGG